MFHLREEATDDSIENTENRISGKGKAPDAQLLQFSFPSLMKVFFWVVFHAGKEAVDPRGKLVIKEERMVQIPKATNKESTQRIDMGRRTGKRRFPEETTGG